MFLDTHYMGLVAGVIMVLATLIAVLFADRWGRHALFLSGESPACELVPSGQMV